MRRVTISEVVDARPFVAFQGVVIALCALVVFLEGFDSQSIGYVAPAMSKAFHLKRGALGPAFSAGMVGLGIGSLLIAPIADRVGRKWVIILSTLMFGLLSLATLATNSLAGLVLVRLLTGIGLGAAMPNAISLTSEFSPKRTSGLLVMLMFCGYSLGSALGGVVAAWMIADFGWKSVFLFGGVLPVLIAPILAIWLPESVRFLALKETGQARALKLLSRIAPDLQTSDTRVVADEEDAPAMSIRQLFTHGRAAATILIWVVFAMSLLDINLVVAWLPTTLNAAGASMGTAALTGSIFQIGGIIGTVALGLIFDRGKPGWILAGAYTLGALCLGMIAFATATGATTLAIVAGAGFGIVGGQIGTNAVVARTYPTAIRSTGIGWALGIGRVGSIVGPLIGGVLIGFHMPPERLFLFSVVPTLIAALACVGLALIRGESREPVLMLSAAD